MQAMVIFAGNNKDNYPLPSRVDRNDKTISSDNLNSPQEKNTTGNIFSILIAQGVIESSLGFSPVELGNYDEYTDYEFDTPCGGVDGQIQDQASEAIWDPNFKATPEDLGADDGEMGSSCIDNYDALPGGFSYAHIPPFAFRRPQWSNTFDALEPALANRGPVYELDGSGETGTWSLIDDSGATADGMTPLGKNSVTLAMNGNRTEWAGNIGFNDAHVEFFNRPDPEQVIWTYTDLENENKNQPDNIFMNEDDGDREVVQEPDSEVELTGENNNRNAYLTQYYDLEVGSGQTTISPYYD